ncbi:zinc finger protein 467-like isoform X3 [Centruroides sculpturatus]|uniref:zinc finger protein 467-like isoform X3 n=1 Tax=Centruroides sculpturatus TaxID=218467 RepID=UPI000C6D41A8|nr:zinc finger protein 467-like isoform X3 [Centruroides sculpturatus]
MASTPEQVVCTPTFVFPAAFPGGGEVGARMKGHRTAQPELSEGRPILMPHLAACHLSTWQGFDPRPHLANFHPIAGATPPPPPLQHPEDQKSKVANRNTGVKPQSQTTNNDFSAGRNLAPAVPTSVAYSVDTGKIPSGTIEKQEPEALKDKLWPCPSCKVPFKAASELQAHLSAHTKGEKTVPCEICGKLFASVERVRIHIRAAHGEKSCSCDICGSGFSYRCKLLDHMRTHTGDKPFHCDICGKSFSQKNHLTRHSMIHTGERPYPCDFCGRGFYRKDKLTRHRRIHTVGKSLLRVASVEKDLLKKEI